LGLESSLGLDRVIFEPSTAKGDEDPISIALHRTARPLGQAHLKQAKGTNNSMRPKALLVLGTTLASLSIGLLAGPASAGTGFSCGATAQFAPLADAAGYVQMHAIRSSSATSSVFAASCVAFLEPQIRVVAQNVGNPSATLTVSVQYTDATGFHNNTIGTLSGYSRWQASPILSFAPSELRGNVQVTLTASGSLSDWLVSGVYIDPYMSR